MMDNLIEKALHNAGYYGCEVSEESLIDCFKDYVDNGYWSNLELEDVDDLTVEQMCKGLLQIK